MWFPFFYALVVGALCSGIDGAILEWHKWGMDLKSTKGLEPFTKNKLREEVSKYLAAHRGNKSSCPFRDVDLDDETYLCDFQPLTDASGIDHTCRNLRKKCNWKESFAPGKCLHQAEG